ncbi:MAG: T9SS type A sorting domain-containing protein [Bacteroidetes bacterium]|nr:T9SS type A sorting domain-containing protein [Bacteroidota bacterium]
MKNFNLLWSKCLLASVFFLFFYGSAKSQYYEWAFAPSFVLHGSYGSFKSTDMHGNGYYIGIEIPNLGYGKTVIRSYEPNGQIIWSLTYSSPYEILGVDADSAGNRYVLLDISIWSGVFGNFNISEDFALIKYDSVGTVVRATGLIEKFNQIKVDSVGNAFISTGTKVVRYNKFGLLSWQYTTPFEHKLFVDNAKNNYLVNDSIALKLNPSGILKYTLVEQGPKVVDSKGRLYVSTTGGMKRYDKFGIFQFNRPAITGTIQTNNNGNIYEFRNDSILKYNQSGTTLQWLFDDAPSEGIVNAFGDIYFGDNYNVTKDDLQLCPFRIKSEPYTFQYDDDQIWVAKLNGKDQPPFQAAIYTNLIRNDSQGGISDPNVLCGSMGGISGVGTLLSNSTLFDFCTNAVSSFDPGNQFSLEISDLSGSFANPISLINPATAVLPDSIPYGTYRIRVVSSTPGVTYHENLPYADYGVKIYPNKADLSITGSQNLCDGDSLQLTVSISDTNGYVNWINSGDWISGATSYNHTIDTSGVYYVFVDNYACHRYSDTLYVDLKPTPSPTVSPTGPFYICSGENVPLEVSDVDLTSISWQSYGSALSGAIDTSYIVLTSGLYSAVVTNQFGCKETTSDVYVHVSPPCRIGQFNSEDSEIEIYPNPVRSNADLVISGMNGGENLISIYDAAGKEVFKQSFYSEKGSHFIVAGNQFLNGVYLVRILNGENLVRQMFVKM